MAADLYPYVLLCDWPYPLNKVMGPRELERHTAALDPRDGESLNAVITAAARRHRRRDLTLYRLNVYHPRTGVLVVDEYRYTAWLAEEYPPASLQDL